MRLLILLFLSIPILVNSQEQVSNINFERAESSTYLNGTVGFAKIADVNYMLIERDSLVIYEWENDVFKKKHVLENPICNYLGPWTMVLERNRSLFDIRDGKYYRDIRNGIQIIDIVSGEVDYQYLGESDGFTDILIEELTEDKLYFRGRIGQEFKYYVKNLVSLDLQETIREDRIYFKQRGDVLISLESGEEVHMTNLETGVDVPLIKLQTFFEDVDFSVSDSTFVIREESGTIYKVDQDFVVSEYSCLLNISDRIKLANVNGDRLIVLYSNTDFNEEKDSVAVINLNTCEKELSYLTSMPEGFGIDSRFIINEGNNRDFSLFGLTGSHPADGPDIGLFQFIDHRTNEHSEITDISGIVTNTPFEHNGSIYFVGFNNSAWVGSNELLVKYDLSSKEFTQYRPYAYNTNRVSIGFDENNEIIFAANSVDEEPAVWTLDASDNLENVLPLNFDYNLGLSNVRDVTPTDDKLFFTCDDGLYSVFENDKKELDLDFTVPLDANWRNERVFSIFENKLCLGQNFIAQPILRVLDLETGEKEVYDDLIPIGSRYCLAGPYAFHSLGSTSDELQIFNYVTGESQTYPEVPYVSCGNLAPGEKSALFIVDGFSSSLPSHAYKIDYATDQINKIDIELERFSGAVAVADDSYYLFERNVNSVVSRIHLLRGDGSLVEIFNETGVVVDLVQSESTNDNFIVLRDGGQSTIVITNNLTDTDIKVIPDTNSFGVVAVKGVADNKLILETRQNVNIQYWILEAFGELKQIDNPSNVSLDYLGTDGEDLIFIDRSDPLSLNVLKYNIVNEWSKISSVPLDNEILRINDWQLQDGTFALLNVRSDLGYEPWVLNMEQNSLNLLKDIAPGNSSSYPGDLIKFKDWIYFTATLKDRSTQWFRVKLSSGTVHTVEQISEIEKLKVFPSPAASIVMIDKDLQLLNIYDVSGQLILSINDYLKDNHIDLQELATGRYFVSGINNKGKVYKGQFVKVKS